MGGNLTVFGDPIDQGALDQITVLMQDDRMVAGALMADHHLGYSMPIGGVGAYQDAISPSGVGYDIACGNMAVQTNLKGDIFQGDRYGSNLKAIMREIQRTVSFGMGRSRQLQNDPVLDHDIWADDLWPEIEKVFDDKLWVKARQQLGTVGSGNHYVDLLLDEENNIWVANHFGSRGFGHTLASWFLNETNTKDGDACVIDVNTDLGQFYIKAMELAGDYAYAGREYVIDQVLGILGAEAVATVHNHHNYAWFENGLWVVRKGATPLTPEAAFIGGSMGDASYIVRGVTQGLLVTGEQHSTDPPVGAVQDLGNIGSAPHGAGRVMSRTAAAGKLRKMWVCPNRNCDFEPERCSGPESGYDSNHCPKCSIPLRRERVRDVTTAAIDWDSVRVGLDERGIVVLGAGADEAPGVYKSLEDVLASHANIQLLQRLDPIGVVMAGSDDYDPYKD